jgi:MFS transporter, DHA1 family, tetracycline resistance protein
MSEVAPVPPSTNPPRSALGIIFLIVLLDLMGFGIIIPLLPLYAKKFDASPLQVTVLFSIYSICQFLASPILGTISDRHGRRPVLVMSQIGSALGYVLLAIVTQLQWTNAALALGLIYLSRIIDGLSAGNISTAQAYISDVTTPENRAKGMGMIGAAFGVGFAVGPFLGGALGKHHPSWPGYAAAIFCTGAAILTWLRLPESRVHHEAQDEVWLHPSRFGPILRSSMLVQLLLISFLTMAAFVIMESVIALFLAEHMHYGELEVGLFFGFLGVVILIVQGGLIGRLTRAVGEWPLAIAGPLLVAIGMLCFARLGSTPVLGLLLIGGAINATGRSLQQPTMSSLISKFTPRADQGTVFGMYHGIGSLARVAGPIVAGMTYEWHGRWFGNNTWPFVIAAITVTIGALWMLMVMMSVRRQLMPTQTKEMEPRLG